MATPLLEIRNLTIRFGGRPAVQNLSLTLEAGETLGVVGESGSGKSVTALAILRLLEGNAEVEGSILLDGVELRSLGDEQMRQRRGRDIAMIFQEPMTALNPVMPVGRQVAEALYAHQSELKSRQIKARALEALEAVAIPEAARRYNDYPYQFSGGQRQRILIAMAILNRPRLLIADEPTTALDVTVQAQILDLLASLREQYGLTMLFISHDLGVIARIANRVLVMRHGVALEQGSREQIFAHPAHAYTRSLLGAVPTLRQDRTVPLASLPSTALLGEGNLQEIEPGHWLRK